MVLTTVGRGFDARALARELVGARLCACVNVIPAAESVYRWNDAIEEDGEQLLIIKTIDSTLDALRDALFARHPYDVPEFVVIPVAQIDAAYRAWLLDAATPRAR